MVSQTNLVNNNASIVCRILSVLFWLLKLFFGKEIILQTRHVKEPYEYERNTS
jgi:hypothetical protein